jgi:hypothetical protein
VKEREGHHHDHSFAAQYTFAAKPTRPRRPAGSMSLQAACWPKHIDDIPTISWAVKKHSHESGEKSTGACHA